MMNTRIFPIFGMFDVAMLDGIYMDVIEARPKIAFAADTGIPVTVPNRSAQRMIQRVQFFGSPPIQPLHELSQFNSMPRKKEKVIMVGKDNPCRQIRIELGDQLFECLDPDREMRVGRYDALFVYDGSGDEIPCVVNVEVRWAMRGG